MVATVFLAGAGADSPHPRPDFERSAWQSLNGMWEFQFAPENREGTTPLQVSPLDDRPYQGTIRVPFGWESPLSGVQRTDYKGEAWYRREFAIPPSWQGKRVWLCFGAVDYRAEVWVNGQRVGDHEGGYSEFRFDITPQVRYDRPNQLVVVAEDRTDHETPIGKQTPSWYTSTSGIWQTVWLEATGQAYVQSHRIVCEADEAGVPNGKVQITVAIERGGIEAPMTVEIRSTEKQFPTVRQELAPNAESATLTLTVPGARFWTPETPHLYPFEIRLIRGDTIEDTVRGYFGIRTVRWGRYGGAEHSYLLLNGKPIFLRGVLDQSFNPDGVYTAPNDAFLKRDIELAKQAGFNMIRIHIKADEPRKLYWADRLGILVQADIPCTFNISERARQTFEKTLRDQIARDFNHPSLIIWTVFNEEWGIGQINNTDRAHRVDWVLKMVQLTRELDPTRLVQDNSGWAHLETDLNSFHWYSRGVDAFRSVYQQINRNEIGVGKAWNYIDGRTSRGEPFINNEYGYLAAFDGDGDWSWGNLFATNALRSLDKLVGYTYTELTDVEWEHNGVYNYDRSPKEFGYDFWAPRMSVRDLFAEDFLVIDLPAIKRAQPGETVQVPLLFSHYSGRFVTKPIRLYYRLDWIDTLGKRHRGAVQSLRFASVPSYQVVPLATVSVSLPDEPCLATLVAWIEDQSETRIHINYTQWAVGLENLPRVVQDGRRRVLVRFDPTQYARSEFNRLSQPEKPIRSKHYGQGHGYVEYTIAIPNEVDLSRLRAIRLRMEVGAKAGREKVDWAQRVHPDDYPQTDGKKYPTRVLVDIAGVRVATWSLPDDPADARGVLSHWAGVERGSYGYLQTATLTVNDALRSQLAQNRTLTLRLTVPPDLPGGLAIYGAGMGCYPMDPTLEFEMR
ncbi:MAG: sugar-binding domain-containing protein [Fimbriimonadales bacterium]